MTYENFHFDLSDNGVATVLIDRMSLGAWSRTTSRLS